MSPLAVICLSALEKLAKKRGHFRNDKHGLFMIQVFFGHEDAVRTGGQPPFTVSDVGVYGRQEDHTLELYFRPSESMNSFRSGLINLRMLNSCLTKIVLAIC